MQTCVQGMHIDCYYVCNIASDIQLRALYSLGTYKYTSSAGKIAAANIYIYKGYRKYEAGMRSVLKCDLKAEARHYISRLSGPFEVLNFIRETPAHEHKT